MKFGVADYGMNVWAGDLYNIEERLLGLKEIGYDGTERLEAVSPSDALHKAGLYRKLGMDFSTCRGPSAQVGIEWTAALGKKYVWLALKNNSRTSDLEVFCRQANLMAKSCARWGITAAIHNHLGQRIENQKELEDFLKKCPEIGMILDTGHLDAAGGDPVAIIKKYHRRLCVMHLKDVVIENPGDPAARKVRFCELGAGATGLDNAKVMATLKDVGYDGWVHIEHDHHRQDPFKDLAISRKFLKQAGF